MDPVSLIQNIYTLITAIQAQAEKAKANQQQCQRLSKRISSITASIKDLEEAKDTPKLRANLDNMKNHLKQALDLIVEHSAADKYKRFFKAGNHEQRFADIYRNLSEAVQELQLGISVQHFVNAKEDSKDQQADRAYIEEQLRKIKEGQDAIKDVIVQGNQDIFDAIDEQPEIIADKMKPHFVLINERLGFVLDRLPEAKSRPRVGEFNSSGQITLDLTIPYSELVLGTEIRRGAFGIVHNAKWHDRPVAVKQLLLTNPSEKDKTEFKQEAAMMFKVGTASNSSHIVQLYGITTQPHLNLVMELMPNGNLYELLQNNRDKPLEWGIRYRLAMDISTGLGDIHRHGVLHRDLKSLNVLLDGNLRAKLADFGLATTKMTSSRHSSVKGTPHWMAPEVIKGSRATEGSDVYSLGMVFWEIATHQKPYSHLENDTQVMFQVAEGKQETIPANCPTNFKQLILDCWSIAAKRPKATEVTTRLRPLVDSKSNQDIPSPDPVLHNPKQPPAPPTRPHLPPPEEKTPGLAAFQTGYQLYHQGQYLQALPHLKQAVKAGYAPAYIDLGVMHELGLGVDKEVDEATIWYKKAQRSESWFEQQADSEEAMAQFYLGRYYQFAAGSKKDGLEASGWYRRAAKQGHAEAQCSLGDCYANGIGVSKDLAQAKQWYEKAAAQGNVHAKAQLSTLQRPSTPPPPPPPPVVDPKPVPDPGRGYGPRLFDPKPSSDAKQPVVDEKALGQLLKCVAEGEQDQAEALIKKDSKLLLAAGKVTDLSGRTFDNITAFQYALWAMDYHMWTMIQKYLPTEAQAEQHQILESKGTAHGKHFDLQPLLAALKTYVDNFNTWSFDQSKEPWSKKVGGAQKLLPAHVVNEYCRPDRPFEPCPSEWTSSLPRTRAIMFRIKSQWVEGTWFLPPTPSEALGSSFAAMRAEAPGCVVMVGVGGPYPVAHADLKSLQALWNARTQQLKVLADTLAPVSTPVADAKALGQLLKFVAEGEQDEAEALIKKDSKLLLAAGKVTDLSGRTFDNITAFQYALWAMDYHMWTMIQKYLPTEAQAKQHAMLESKGTAYDKHYNLKPLLYALENFTNCHDDFTDNERKREWSKIGGIQKLLPAHIANEYCRLDRPFSPCPKEWKSRLPRTLEAKSYNTKLSYHAVVKVVKGQWFTLLAENSLDSSRAFYRNNQPGASLLSYGILPEAAVYAKADCSALSGLWNARTQQLKLLADTLVVESQSSMKVRLK